MTAAATVAPHSEERRHRGHHRGGPVSCGLQRNSAIRGGVRDTRKSTLSFDAPRHATTNSSMRLPAARSERAHVSARGGRICRPPPAPSAVEGVPALTGFRACPAPAPRNSLLDIGGFRTTPRRFRTPPPVAVPRQPFGVAKESAPDPPPSAPRPRHRRHPDGQRRHPRTGEARRAARSASGEDRRHPARRDGRGDGTSFLRLRVS